MRRKERLREEVKDEQIALLFLEREFGVLSQGIRGEGAAVFY